MAMMGTEAPDDALYEMLNIVGGRIKQAVTATGREATLDVPNVEMLGNAPAPTLSPACLVLAFGVQGQPFALTVICDADPPARRAIRRVIDRNWGPRQVMDRRRIRVRIRCSSRTPHAAFRTPN